jgi:hypothetical protein
MRIPCGDQVRGSLGQKQVARCVRFLGQLQEEFRITSGGMQDLLETFDRESRPVAGEQRTAAEQFGIRKIPGGGSDRTLQKLIGAARVGGPNCPCSVVESDGIVSRRALPNEQCGASEGQPTQNP